MSRDIAKHDTIMRIAMRIAKSAATRGAHGRKIVIDGVLAGYEFDVDLTGISTPKGKPLAMIHARFYSTKAWDHFDYDMLAGGLGGSVGILIRLGSAPKLLKTVRTLLESKGGGFFSVVVHEVTHFVDDLDGLIVRNTKNGKPPFAEIGSKKYYNEGWEQEARQHEALVDVRSALTSWLQVAGLDWAAVKAYKGGRILDTDKAFAELLSASRKNLLYGHFLKHYTPKGRARFEKRLRAAYPWLLRRALLDYLKPKQGQRKMKPAFDAYVKAMKNDPVYAKLVAPTLQPATEKGE